jgi:hypothetical protein
VLLEDDREEFLQHDGRGRLVTQTISNVFCKLVEPSEVRLGRKLRILFPSHQERQPSKIELGIGPGRLSGELLSGR